MKKNLFILFLIMIILPLKVEAAGKVSISCSPSTIKAGSESKCIVSGTSDDDITDISADIKLSDNLIVSSFEPDQAWDGNDIDNGKMDIYSKSGDSLNDNFKIGVFTIKVKDDIVNTDEIFSLSSIVFSKDYDEITVLDASAKIRIANNVNTLKSLEVDGISLSPKFDKDTTNYKVSTSSKSININAVSTDSSAKVDGTGIHELKNGTNNIEIKVTAEDGSVKTYSIVVNADLSDKKDEGNNDNIGGNKEDNSGSSNKNDKTDEEITENEKTGDTSIVIICTIGLLSLFGLIYYFKKRNISINKI